jgi:diguanylate cyclase (GGDEF)-like protein
MGSCEVFCLPDDDIETFLDRHRYAAFVPARRPVDRFLREILSKANDFVPSAAGSILMDRSPERCPEPERRWLYFVAAFGPRADQLPGRSLSAAEGVAGYVYRTGTAYVMESPEDDPNFCAEVDRSSGFTTSSLVAVPIRIEDAVCGVLELINRLDGRAYTSSDQQLLEIFARYTSLSIENLLDARRASEMAQLDDLTGLYNDRHFHHRLTEHLVRADLQRSSVALVFLDLDNFKYVNDTHGHLAGSQVLKEFGYLLQHTVSEPDVTLARYGGDEFVIILPDHDLVAARQVAERVRQSLRSTDFLRGTFSWSTGPINWRDPLSCSLGVAVYPDHVRREGTTDLKKNLLLRAADRAMYAAKDAGKDRVFVAE